jgi:hypothetical protein
VKLPDEAVHAVPVIVLLSASVVVELQTVGVVPPIVRLLLYTAKVAVLLHSPLDAVMTSTSLAVGAANVGTLYVTLAPKGLTKLPYVAVQVVPVIPLVSASVVVELHTDTAGAPVIVRLLLYTVKEAVGIQRLLVAVIVTAWLAVGAAKVGTL